MKTYKKKFISLIIFSHDFSGVLIFFVLSKKQQMKERLNY